MSPKEHTLSTKLSLRDCRTASEILVRKPGACVTNFNLTPVLKYLTAFCCVLSLSALGLGNIFWQMNVRTPTSSIPWFKMTTFSGLRLGNIFLANERSHSHRSVTWVDLNHFFIHDYCNNHSRAFKTRTLLPPQENKHCLSVHWASTFTSEKRIHLWTFEHCRQFRVCALSVVL